MRSLARLLLLCLMVLALPVQAVAAASMLHCTGMPSTGSADRAAPAAPCHGHDGHAHGGADAAAAVGHAGEPSAPHDTPARSHVCSACAACLAGVGLAAAPLWVPVLPQPSRVEPMARRHAESFVPGGLDRPPRAG